MRTTRRDLQLHVLFLVSLLSLDQNSRFDWYIWNLVLTGLHQGTGTSLVCPTFHKYCNLVKFRTRTIEFIRPVQAWRVAGLSVDRESVEGILQSHNIASFFEWWVYESQNSAPNFLHVFVIGPGVLYYWFNFLSRSIFHWKSTSRKCNRVKNGSPGAWYRLFSFTDFLVNWQNGKLLKSGEGARASSQTNHAGLLPNFKCA